jgi:hypothetical protein
MEIGLCTKHFLGTLTADAANCVNAHENHIDNCHSNCQLDISLTEHSLLVAYRYSGTGDYDTQESKCSANNVPNPTVSQMLCHLPS